MPTVVLQKLHGLGNDFLVCDMAQPLPRLGWDVLARRWCHRTRGIGADGLLLLSWDLHAPEQLAMGLHNADGSRAVMSGNGVRCVAHAAYRAQERQGPVSYQVATEAGVREIAVQPGDDQRTVLASVDMGQISLIDPPAAWPAVGADPGRPVAHVGVGNPHTVVGVEDVHDLDLASIGARLSDVNLEVVAAGPEPDAVTMRVHERGAGITEACGTGACAAAWAAARWGLVAAGSGEITVHMDGGDAKVLLDTPAADHVTLVGPSVHVATVYVEA
jgi:diaminopimelate epimerase